MHSKQVSNLLTSIDAKTSTLPQLSYDSFGRLRTSQAVTIFESNQNFDNNPLLYDESQGVNTTITYDSTNACTNLNNTENNIGTAVRQSFRHFKYESGKSMLLLITGVLHSTASGTGIGRIGYFDDDNGLFFEYDQGVKVAIRKNSATVYVNQLEWNIDVLNGNGVSGTTLDVTKSQIFFINLAWLGVGKTVLGFVIDGKFVPCHAFEVANVSSDVHFPNPNLPIRIKMESKIDSSAFFVKHICAAVFIEAMLSKVLMPRILKTSVLLEGLNANSDVCIFSMRLKSTHLAATIQLSSLELFITTVSDYGMYRWVLDGTITSEPAFTSNANSAIEYYFSDTASYDGGGTELFGGYIASGGNASGNRGVFFKANSQFSLGSYIDGTSQTLSLVYTSLLGTQKLYALVRYEE